MKLIRTKKRANRSNLLCVVRTEMMQKYISIQLAYELQYFWDMAGLQANTPDRITNKEKTKKMLSRALIELGLLPVNSTLAKARSREI